ncbi:hypothetical protein BTA51_22635 [Hahella sp. CCB-MM4]|nr:hypothetical protein BTA51_22635 [Hahella sp. CCB-MM4]
MHLLVYLVQSWFCLFQSDPLCFSQNHFFNQNHYSISAILSISQNPLFKKATDAFNKSESAK